jgi:diguanylate cyclase (GGDEF)-like protein
MFDAALRDGLTKAFNRKYFLTRLDTELAYARRHASPLSLVMLDVDHFKKINDTYGHVAGDGVLVMLAQLVMKTIRSEDVFARYGGEEFAIILPEIDKHNALQFGEKIRRITEKAVFRFEDTEIPVTVSVGIATLTPEIQELTDFIKVADDQLYSAKAAGRNRVVG